MIALRALVSRLLEPLLARRRDARLAEELQSHLDLMADDLVARGMAPEDARDAARRALGGAAQVTANYREQRGLPRFEAAVLDLRFAARVLMRDRRFAVTAVLVLGLGLGVNTTLFTIFNAICLRGLPIADSARVLDISTMDRAGNGGGVSYAELQDIRAGATLFEGIAAFLDVPLVLGETRASGRTGSGRLHLRERVLAAAGSAASRAGLDGRGRTRGRAARGAVGARLWRARYDADRRALGRVVRLDGRDTTIVGVVEEGFAFPGGAEVWLPLSQMPGLASQAARCAHAGRARSCAHRARSVGAGADRSHRRSRVPRTSGHQRGPPRARGAHQRSLTRAARPIRSGWRF